MRYLLFTLLLLSAFSRANNLPKEFGYIDQHIPDVVQDIRYHGNNNFMGKPVRGYIQPRAILSLEALQALKAVQEEISPFGLGIKVFDAYRPQQAVDHFIEWAKDLQDTANKPHYYPDVNKADLFAQGYIASRSGHSRGSTIDLTLVYSDTLEEVDMGSSYDFFGKQSWPSSDSVSDQQRANRLLLKAVMEKHGFSAYSKEWWHFRLKDEPYSDTYFNFPVR